MAAIIFLQKLIITLIDVLMYPTSFSRIKVRLVSKLFKRVEFQTTLTLNNFLFLKMMLDTLKHQLTLLLILSALASNLKSDHIIFLSPIRKTCQKN